MARYRAKHRHGGRAGLLAAFLASVLVVTAMGAAAFAGLRGRLRHPRPAGAATRLAAGPVANARSPIPTPTPAPTPDVTRLLPGQAAWVVSENRQPGTSAWRIPPKTPDDIEGYADRVSAVVGDAVTLRVSTDAREFHVEAYRLGYYGGRGGRSIWRSTESPGEVQPAPTVEPGTNMVESNWKPSVTFTIGGDWPQGDYVLKLVASNGAQRYVPLTVRDDSSHAALVIQNSVTTWQAYNRWGGRSLYAGPGGFGDRSRIVSFDRPYDIGRGAGAVIGGNELPVVMLAEKLGLDVTYWTDVDLHERPELLGNHRALISLGHDEYWSTAMRDGALAARAEGVNLAFLGANAMFRHIRLQASPLGPDREEVAYKDAVEDPMSGVNDAEVTVNWRQQPLDWPETELLGEMYECNPVRDDMLVVDPPVWLFGKTGVKDGDRVPNLVGSEYDRVMSNEPTPASLQILAHSPVDCHGWQSHSDMTYYTASSGAGVFDSGSSVWTTAIGESCVLTGRCGPISKVVMRVTVNLLRAFAAGPAGVRHPSEPNTEALGLTLRKPIAP